jgi:hypothetical protein
MPSPAAGPSTGGTGIGCGGALCAGGGTTSTCGRTHPAAGWAAVTAAAAATPHTAAADAPPLIALRTAQGSYCVDAGAEAAIAPVELKIIDPAIIAPINPDFRMPAMCLLLAQREVAPALEIDRTH